MGEGWRVSLVGVIVVSRWWYQGVAVPDVMLVDGDDPWMSRHFIGPDRAVGGASVPVNPDEESFGAVIDMVDAVDLSVFEDRYRADGSGGRPYDPRLVVVAILWCAQQQIRSPSRVARECLRQVVLREWFGGRVPGRSTLRRFIVHRQEAWRRTFPQVLALCDGVGLVDAAVTATDGTVLASAGSLRGELPLWRIRQFLREVEDALAALAAGNTAAAVALDGDGAVDAFVDEVCGDACVLEQRLRRRLARLQAAERVATQRAAATDHRDVSAITARLTRQQATLAEMIATQQAKCDRYATNVAACPHGAGMAPKPPLEHSAIIRQQAAVARTQKNC